MSNSEATVLPLYTKKSVDVSRLRTFALFLARILVAAVYGALVVALPIERAFLLAIPIIVMLLIVLWMLPDRGTFPAHTLGRTFQLYFVFSIIWPVYIAVDLPGLPWVTPTRMLLFVQTLLLLYSVSISGALRHQLLDTVRASAPFWACLVAWELMGLLTLPMSRSPVTSAKFFLDEKITLLGPLLVSCFVASQKGKVKWLVSALIVIAVVTSLDGFLEAKLQYPPWAFHIPSFLRVDDSIMATVLGAQARTGDGLYRVRGPFPLSLLFSEFLALCMPFVIHSIFTSKSIPRRIIMVFVFFIVLTAIIITQSRLGLVGTLIAAVCYPVMWAVRKAREDKGGMFGPVVLIAMPLAALLMVGVILSSHTATLKVFGGGAQSASDDARRIQRQMALPKILHNPLGYGLGQSGQVLGYTNPAGALTIDSGLLSIALDLGVIGLFSFFGMILVVAYRGVKLYLGALDDEIGLAGPAAISLLVFLVIRTILSQNNNWPIAMILIGAVLGLIRRQSALMRQR